jgi:hypothetical protein
MADVVPSALVYALDQLARARKNGHLPERSDLTLEWLIEELEFAGRILQCMPARGTYPAGYGSNWPDIVRAFEDAYGWTAEEQRPYQPNAQDIARMDRALSWIGLIPESKRVWRRLILLRSLMHWQSEKYVWSWRKISRQFGRTHEYWRDQWEQAVSLLHREILQRDR